jgi:hypothetical protein
MGPGEGASETDRHMASELGGLIARERWVLLTGGRNAGVMDAAATGAQKGGTLTVGILPSDDATSVSPGVDIAIISGIGEARNLINVLSSRVVFVCGMSPGTASEVALALKTERDVILIQPSPESRAFWTSLDARRIHVAAGPPEAVDIARRLIEEER